MDQNSHSDLVPKGRQCIFCGSTKGLTREHAVPRWVSKLVFRNEPIHAYTGIDGVRPLRSYVSRGITAAPRIVCRDCNNGWLHRLEVRARDAIGPIMIGQRKTLSEADQAAASLWVLKTAIVLERDRPVPPMIPAWHARYLLEHQDLPPQSRAWLAYQRGFEEIGVHFFPIPHTDLFRGPENFDVRGYVVTLTVGRAVFQVYAMASEGFGVVLDQAYDTDGGYAASIWPPTAPVNWPTENGLTYEELDRFAHRHEPKEGDRMMVAVSGEMHEAVRLDHL